MAQFKFITITVLIFLITVSTTTYGQVDSIRAEISKAEKKLNNQKAKIADLNIELEAAERLEKVREENDKKREKNEKEAKRKYRDSLREAKLDKLREIIDSSKYMIDSIENRINELILNDETPFNSKIKINNNCSVALTSKEDDFYFNLTSTTWEKTDFYKINRGALFKKTSTIEFPSFSINCSPEKKCIRKNKKYINNTDQTLPFMSNSAVTMLLKEFKELRGVCENNLK